MPIISLKRNPPSRFPEKSILDSDSNWWIAKVKSRQEKILAFKLLELGIEYYLPFYAKVSIRKNTGKKQTSILPLFPSYVPFVYESSPYELLQENSVATILPIKRQEQFKKELNRIYEATENGEKLTPFEYGKFNIGSSVQVRSGAFKGVVGRVNSVKDSSIVLNVCSIGSVLLTVDYEDLDFLSINSDINN